MASVITNISIKNIKGYGDPATSITLELKTNRVNIIYAPNGTGKSSIVAAFRSLNRNTLSPLKDDMYHKDETLLPELSIMMDGRTYSADKVSNTINPVLEPYVINSGTIVNTVRQNIGGKYTKVSGYLDIENIVVINNIPPIVRPHYRITEIRTEFGKNGKILTRRDDLFANNTAFWKACEEIGPKLDFFRSAQFRRQLVDNIKVAIQTLEGTTDYIKNNVQDNWFEALERNRVFDEIMQGLNFFTTGMNKLDRFDLFYQVLYFWSQTKHEIKNANKRTAYEEQRARFDANLALLDTTWKNIRSVEEDNALVVQFPHADEISNGQRDILTLVVELLKFKSLIQSDKKYILLIDEVFDYLDDANTITAQYFLSEFLQRDRENLFLCMFTHLNPFTFRNYIFSEKKINYVYLQQTQPVATKAMMAFIASRQGLDRKDAEQARLYNSLSHDLFHYNPVVADYSSQIMPYKKTADLNQNFGKTSVLHQILIDEVNKYLRGDQVYDPYAVAMALRLRVEKIIYNQLKDQPQKNAFISEKTTKNKFKFAEDNAIIIPDILYLVNAIHNEADHLKYDATTHVYFEKSMVYKLQNNIIKGIIKQIFEWENKILTTQVID